LLQAAEGVSAADLAKRRELEKYKRNALKNLNMFVSSTRYQRESHSDTGSHSPIV
jgi:hypothetical protein